MVYYGALKNLSRISLKVAAVPQMQAHRRGMQERKRSTQGCKHSMRRGIVLCQ